MGWQHDHSVGGGGHAVVPVNAVPVAPSLLKLANDVVRIEVGAEKVHHVYAHVGVDPGAGVALHHLFRQSPVRLEVQHMGQDNAVESYIYGKHTDKHVLHQVYFKPSVAFCQQETPDGETCRYGH